MRPSAQDNASDLENTDRHPAVQAWLTLDPNNRMPANVVPLYAASVENKKNRDRRKSSVFRLDRAEQTGASIVAKLCSPQTASLERLIYEQILPRLPVSTLHYHGHLDTGDSHWLFLEYADGVEWQIDDRTHVELAIRWLAEMHDSAAQVRSLSLLPRRGPDHYLSQMTTARQRILKNISNPALEAASIRILDEFTACSSVLETRWQEVEAFCKTVPETLVHNDFISKNVKVRNTQPIPVLLVFDWEVSGTGVPATDLFWLFQHAPRAGIARYWEHRRKFDPGIELQDIKYLATLGVVFRVMDAVEWLSYYLLTDYPNRKIDHVRLHTDWLKHAFDALGWP